MIHQLVPCTTCRREVDAWRFTPAQGGDISRRVCGVCVRHEEAIERESRRSKQDLVDPKQPRTCWSCHDQPTHSRRATVCKNCADERKRGQTRLSAARKWFTEASLRPKPGAWKAPGDWNTMVVLVSAQHEVRRLGRRLDDIEVLGAEEPLNGDLIKEAVETAATNLVGSIQELGDEA
jgi:hypothetical protein